MLRGMWFRCVTPHTMESVRRKKFFREGNVRRGRSIEREHVLWKKRFWVEKFD